jgi:hypothetical protein
MKIILSLIAIVSLFTANAFAGEAHKKAAKPMAGAKAPAKDAAAATSTTTEAAPATATTTPAN